MILQISVICFLCFKQICYLHYFNQICLKNSFTVMLVSLSTSLQKSHSSRASQQQQIGRENSFLAIQNAKPFGILIQQSGIVAPFDVPAPIAREELNGPFSVFCQSEIKNARSNSICQTNDEKNSYLPTAPLHIKLLFIFQLMSSGFW